MYNNFYIPKMRRLLLFYTLLHYVTPFFMAAWRLLRTLSIAILRSQQPPSKGPFMARITKRAVEAVEPTAKPTFPWDDQLPGVGVKVLPNGLRRYLVKYRAGGGGRAAAQRWYTLGTHGAITAEQARGLAQQVLASVARGGRPPRRQVRLSRGSHHDRTMGALCRGSSADEEEDIPV